MLSVLFALVPLSALPAEALPMPPPPAGMARLGPAQTGALLRAEDLRRALSTLSPANPLRHRLRRALAAPDPRAKAPGEVAPVADVLAFDVSEVRDRYDIPVEMRPAVAEWVRHFQGRGRRWFLTWMNRSSRYIPVMRPILEGEGLPGDLVYLAMIESGFSTRAYSGAHAAGPWQFIPGTADWFGLRRDFWVDERRDPLKSTRAAARYLKLLHRELGHWYLAWAGYNTGGARVRRLVDRHRTTDFWALSGELAEETAHYVPKLIAAALIAKHPFAFGFREEEFDFLPPLRFDVVEVPAATDLSVLARAAGATVDELVALNPELQRWCTPPATQKAPYRLRIPAGHEALFAQRFKEIPAGQRLRYWKHRVKRGDTLIGLARRYGTEVEAIRRLNRLSNPRALRVNAVLVIPVPHQDRTRGRRLPRPRPATSAGPARN